MVSGNSNNLANFSLTLERTPISLDLVEEKLIGIADQAVQYSLEAISKNGILDIASNATAEDPTLRAVQQTYIDIGRQMKDYFINRMSIAMTADTLANIVEGNNIMVGTMGNEAPKPLFDDQQFGKHLGKFIEPAWLGLPVGDKKASSDFNFLYTDLKATSAKNPFQSTNIGQFSIEAFNNAEITESIKNLAGLYKLWDKMRNILHFVINKYEGTGSKSGGTKAYAGEYYHLYPTKEEKIEAKAHNKYVRPITVVALELYMGLLFRKIFKTVYEKAKTNLSSLGNIISVAHRTEKGQTQTKFFFNAQIAGGSLEAGYSLLQLYAMKADLLKEMRTRKDKNTAEKIKRAVSTTNSLTIEQLDAELKAIRINNKYVVEAIREMQEG